MIQRERFTQGHGNPPAPVLLVDGVTVPTELMANLLCSLLNTGGSVLEIGTGSGYQTAVLAEKCREVVSMEIHPLEGVPELLPANVVLLRGDGATSDTGLEFDGVLVTFAAEHIAPMWAKQLRDGRRLVVPLKIGRSCRISVYERRGNQMVLVDVRGYAPFTPQRMAA